MAGPDAPPIKGRGATFNIANRYRRDEREAFDDGWPADDPDAPGPARPRTIVTIQPARTILAHNDSPYDSYINFMNVLDNVRTRLAAERVPQPV